MNLTIFLIGFAVGGAFVGLCTFLLLSGKIKSLTIGKDGFSIVRAEASPGKGDKDEPDAKDVNLPMSGRWLTKVDRPGSRFGRIHEGIPLPGKVRMRQGEVYKFVADQGFQTDQMNLLSKSARCPQLRYLSFHNCVHLSATDLKRLSDFVHLWDLDLSSTKADDTVLESLLQVKSLRQLDLRECTVSGPALAKLAASLPACKVITRSSK
jgi:hypothetical protein